MSKKILFVFLLAAAVVSFAGYSVPTASACSTLVPEDCRPIFGSNFSAVQAVTATSTAPSVAGANSSSPMLLGQYENISADGDGRLSNQSTGAIATTGSAATNSNSIFGPSFQTVITVPSSSAPAVSSTITSVNNATTLFGNLWNYVPEDR
jgi:hypothetical protein